LIHELNFAGSYAILLFTASDLASITSHIHNWVTGKLGLGIWNKTGERLIEFCQENALAIANTLSNNTREDSTHGHHQMVNTKVRLIIFFAAKDEEAL